MLLSPLIITAQWAVEYYLHLIGEQAETQKSLSYLVQFFLTLLTVLQLERFAPYPAVMEY
jgi:hypothetical protein